jgi:Putative Flp pilus-assembly TadE/G-like
MVKPAVRKKENEAGQAVLLLIAAMSVFLLGAVGLAVDGSHLYAQRQAAQAAADAAAVAGIMSIFDSTNTFTSNYNCTTTDGTSPCSFARQNGFKTAAASTDTVSVEVDPAGVTVSHLDPVTPNLLRVTVTRPVSMTLTKLVGLSSFDVSASAMAAIVDVMSPVPIVITDPHRSDALHLGGNDTIKIQGGPSRSIQINSDDPHAFTRNSGSELVDLTQAGPSGTGGDFAVWGGPGSNPGGVSLGTSSHWIQPASPIQDPFQNVPAPAVPATVGQLVSGVYKPGLYDGGLNVTSDAQFAPGIYYVRNGDFHIKNATVTMASGPQDATTGYGMLVYHTGTGVFNIDTKGKLMNLCGAGFPTSGCTGTPTAPYYGILFFQDRTSSTRTHTLGKANSCFLFTGSIYITNTLALMNAGTYQEVDYQGGPCSSTFSTGEIVVSYLNMQGNSEIDMQLSTTNLSVRQIALVQ